MKTKMVMLFTFVVAFFCGCDIMVDSDGYNYGSITVTPVTVTLARGDTQQFTASDSYVTWSLEGTAGSSSINSSGLLTVGVDESASTLTVKATESYGSEFGTAKVTVAALSATPQGLKASKPGPTSIALSWDALSGADEYEIYRSTNGTTFGRIDTVSSITYTDTNVTSGVSYYYRIRAKGVNSNVIFVFAGDYFIMPSFSQKKLVPLKASETHYYRFAVKAGNEYTIEWQNGNSQNAHNNINVTAWQNNGTVAFERTWTNGYTAPKVFTASVSGFLNVQVFNYSSSASYDYQIYCYGTDEETDSGTVALPPYRVSSFQVSVPVEGSISLGWDAVSDAVKYNIYRANTQTGTPSKIGESSTTNYTDTKVDSKVAYWYTIVSVNTDGRESCRFQGAFGVTAPHITLSQHNSQLYALNPKALSYYRFPVIAGQTYTIQWHDGSSPPQNAHSDINVAAWQNDGTVIFGRTYTNSFTSPKNFTATASGFVTVEVWNYSSSIIRNYQIYYY